MLNFHFTFNYFFIFLHILLLYVTSLNLIFILTIMFIKNYQIYAAKFVFMRLCIDSLQLLQEECIIMYEGT
jgi:hypothetical protein